MKKAYTLLISIVLITIFSYLAISILETKSLRSTNLSNQYLYIQGKNHLDFFKSYLLNIDLNARVAWSGTPRAAARASP